MSDMEKNNRPSEHAPNLLADLLVSLIQGHKLSGATREWAVIGVLAYARGEIASMDTALGLSSGGRRHLRTVWDRQYSSKGRPGIDWPSWKQALFRAWCIGREIPRTAAGLHNSDENGVSL